MFNINDFLNYASNGNVSAPAPKTRKPVSQPVRNRYADPILVSTLVTPAKRLTQPSGPVMVHTYQPEPETILIAPAIPIQPSKPALELINYSERSFAIFGDTKPVKDKLEELGGTFNRWLKRDGIPTPGYIFSIKRIDNVRKALSL